MNAKKHSKNSVKKTLEYKKHKMMKNLKILSKNNCKFELCQKGYVYSEISKELSNQKIIGWFNGRAEIGPRALGNRSILTSPFPKEMKDILNSKVKHRESFRPFAPVVRMEDCSKYFDLEQESPYMSFACEVKKEVRELIPAIVHVDGTARIQTVTKKQNKDFYNLISAFNNLTGIGVLINTSFNVMGEPIVNNPQEVLDCFLGTDIDILVINSKFIIRKEKK